MTPVYNTGRIVRKNEKNLICRKIFNSQKSLKTGFNKVRMHAIVINKMYGCRI